MYKKYTLLLSLILSITACSGGGGDSTSTNTSSTQVNKSFAYKTQRSVDLNISLTQDGSSSQKQILFYEIQKIDTTPVGEQLIYDNLLMEGVTDSTGKYFTQVTLGNHVEYIWIIIPALSYEKKVAILNNEIVLNITKGL